MCIGTCCRCCWNEVIICWRLHHTIWHRRLWAWIWGRIYWGRITTAVVLKLLLGLKCSSYLQGNIRDTIENNLLSNRNVSLAKGSLIQKFCTSNLQKRCQKYPTHFPLRWKCSGKGFFTFFRGIKVRVKTFLRLSYLYIKRLLSYHNFFSLESKSQHIIYKLIEMFDKKRWKKLSLVLTFICFNYSLHKTNLCVQNFDGIWSHLK